jgi:peroxin-4
MKDNNSQPHHRPSKMASPSPRAATPTKRLLNELHDYVQEPNDALLRLGPVSDEQMLHWEAVMKGVPGTAYEGVC